MKKQSSIQPQVIESPFSRVPTKNPNTVVGHLLGLGSGLLAVALFGANQAPSVLTTGALTTPRVWTAVLAVILNLLLVLLLKASHPPAAATTLLVALGGFKPTLHDVITVIMGVLIVATAGEILRQVRVKSTPS